METKKAGGAILLSDKINKTNTITRDKGHYIMIKGSESVQQEGTTLEGINIWMEPLFPSLYF